MLSVVPHKRYIDIDTLSGILILQMIFVVHCAKLSGIKGIIIDKEMLIMQFFMPWFFYKSGMFYHVSSIGDTIKKGIRHLIKPFIIFSLVGWLVIVVVPGMFLFHRDIGFLVNDTIRHFLFDGSIRGNYALWFLLSLFIVKCIFSILNNIHVPIFIIVATGSVFAFAHNRYLYNMPVYLGNISNGLLFYSLGYLMRKAQYQRYMLITSLAVFLAMIPFAGYLDFRANAILLGSNNYFITEVFNFCEIIIANNIVRSWGGCNRMNILATVGQSTMILYVTHYIILVVSENALTILLRESNPYVMFGFNSLALIAMLTVIYFAFKNQALKRLCF